MQTSSSLNGPAWLLVAGGVLAALSMARAAPQDPPGTGTESKPAFSVAGSTADSNNRMIAVTGVDITGASILYLVDTESQRLAVYQASGGTASMQGVKLVGARRIDLDMQLDGLNDKSEYTYKKLRQLFSDQGLLKSEAANALEVPDDSSGGD